VTGDGFLYGETIYRSNQVFASKHDSACRVFLEVMQLFEAPAICSDANDPILDPGYQHLRSCQLSPSTKSFLPSKSGTCASFQSIRQRHVAHGTLLQSRQRRRTSCVHVTR